MRASSWRKPRSRPLPWSARLGSSSSSCWRLRQPPRLSRTRQCRDCGSSCSWPLSEVANSQQQSAADRLEAAESRASALQELQQQLKAAQAQTAAGEEAKRDADAAHAAAVGELQQQLCVAEQSVEEGAGTSAGQACCRGGGSAL